MMEGIILAGNTITPITIIKKGDGQSGHTLLYPEPNGCMREITGALKRIILNGGRDLDKHITKDRTESFEGGNTVTMTKGLKVSYMQWLIYSYLKRRAEQVVETTDRSDDIFVSKARSKDQEGCDWVRIGTIADFKPAVIESIKEELGDEFQKLGNNWLFTNLNSLKQKFLVDQTEIREYVVNIELTVAKPAQVIIHKPQQQQKAQLTSIGVIAQSKFDNLQEAIAPAREFWDLIQVVLSYSFDPECQFATEMIELQKSLTTSCADEMFTLNEAIRAQEVTIRQMREVFDEILLRAEFKTFTDQMKE